MSQPEIFHQGGAHQGTATLAVGELVGWRVWNVEFLAGCSFLRSYSHQMLWPPGPLQADKTPELDNSHGIYALKTWKRMLDYVRKPSDFLVLGQVHLWGKVIEGTHGYRAEWAEPLSLVTLVIPNRFVDGCRYDAKHPLIEQLRARYACDDQRELQGALYR
jgi:hypothetical protein